MIIKNIYSKKTLNGIRIIATATLILLLLTTCKKIYDFIINDFYNSYDQSIKNDEIISMCLNCIIIIFSAILIKQPQRFLLISIASLIFSIVAEIYNTSSFTSFLMLVVAIATFLFRFNYKSYKKLALVVFIPVILFDFLFQLTKGTAIFVEMTWQKIEMIFTFGISTFFFCEYSKQNVLRETIKDKVLNLADYKGIERSDLYLLQDVMNNIKYKEIAKKINGSEGALRNKLGKIYKILEVGDKTGFLTIYSGYTLVYEPKQKTAPSSDR